MSNDGQPGPGTLLGARARAQPRRPG